MSDSNTSADLFDDDLLVDIPDGSDSREVSDSDDGVQLIEDSTLHENVSDEDSANEDEPDVTVDFTGVTTSTPISHSDGDETEEISEGEGDTPASAVQPHRTFRVLISVLDLTEFDGSDTSEAVINPDDISSPSEEEEDEVEESNTANDNRRRLPTRAARTRATRAIGALSRPRQPPNASCMTTKSAHNCSNFSVICANQPTQTAKSGKRSRRQCPHFRYAFQSSVPSKKPRRKCTTSLLTGGCGFIRQRSRR
jgi:hypothetical protein